ncbi:MAG: hypothetical protein LBO78_01500, partial [Rickettsiales bacterium]|nr:hypothetical protein [Rickettsiales bacterium]
MRRLMLAFAVLTMLPFAAFAQTVKCPNPAPYGLTNAEVNVSNAEFYCWEIKYMKERLGQLSMSESAYVALYPQPLFVSSAESLREAGITPEKAQYLQDYFLSDGEYSSSISDDRKLVSRLVSAAADVTRNRAEYKIDKFLGLWQVYHSILMFLVFRCVTVSGAISDSNPVVTLIARMLPLSHLIDLPYSDVAISEFVNVHPNKYARHALAPVGVISKSFINAFGEVVGEIKADKDFGFLLMSGASHPFYVNGSSTRAGLWDSATCNIKALGRRVKSSTSCLPCVIF